MSTPLIVMLGEVMIKVKLTESVLPVGISPKTSNSYEPALNPIGDKFVYIENVREVLEKAAHDGRALPFDCKAE